MSDKPLQIAQILTAHGIKGLVKLRVLLEDPQQITAYNPLQDMKGKNYTITLKNPIKGDWIAQIEGMTDRNAAELLRGLKLYTSREALPDLDEDDDTYYADDLIGLTVKENDIEIGKIIGLDNFGAEDLLDIKPDNGKSFYLPLRDEYVHDIDIEAGFITATIPEEFLN